MHEQPKYKNIISEVPEGVGESWYENGGGTNYKFTGKELDPTGLYYFGARYYDPQVSLWMSTDSVLNTYLNFKINKGISNSKNLSLYAYSLLNPINFLDPDGNAAVGDAVFFNWKGFSHPRHVAIVTEVDSAGIPTKAYGLWAQPSGPSEYQTKDLTQIREDGKTYQEFMIGSGKMEGLTSSDIETVKIDFDEKTQDWEGNWEGDEEGFVCIDVITNNDIGLGGEKIRDAMKSDMEKNQDSYSGIDEIIKKDGKINTNNNFNYRKNTILMQFFINQEKFEKIPEKE